MKGKKRRGGEKRGKREREEERGDERALSLGNNMRESRLDAIFVSDV
jgi:hypothetical protein